MNPGWLVSSSVHAPRPCPVGAVCDPVQTPAPSDVPRGTSQSAYRNTIKGHGMIFIVIALFIVTCLLMNPVLGKKLNRKETSMLFIIYLAVGLIVRTILYMFGM